MLCFRKNENANFWLEYIIVCDIIQVLLEPVKVAKLLSNMIESSCFANNQSVCRLLYFVVVLRKQQWQPDCRVTNVKSRVPATTERFFCNRKLAISIDYAVLVEMKMFLKSELSKLVLDFKVTV